MAMWEYSVLNKKTTQQNKKTIVKPKLASIQSSKLYLAIGLLYLELPD